MLYIIATPIGNLEDITLRALCLLKEVDFILAEDTRKTALLLKHFGMEKKLYSFYDHNEAEKIPQVIKALEGGQTCALVSNAGTPTISDPGYKLIRACCEKNLPITAVPGPSSVINALSLTSLPHDKFVFLGYLPRKQSACKKLLSEVKSWNLTAVFFESPFRLLKSLESIKEVFGSRKTAVAREMTKKFEEVKEGAPDELLAYFSTRKPKGELVLIISAEF